MKEVFPLISPGNTALLVILALAAVLAAAVAILVVLVVTLHHGAVEVSAEGLRLRVPLYGRQLPMRALVLDAARPVNLTTEHDLGLKWRTNGIGLPRCHVGWFKLRNGDKVLAAITDPQRVALIPSREGFSLLVSVGDPQGLVDALRRFASTATPDNR